MDPLQGTSIRPSGTIMFLFCTSNLKAKFFCRSGDNRANFRIKEFVAKYNITELVAGNFFEAEWDEYVPLLYKQLGE